MNSDVKEVCKLKFSQIAEEVKELKEGIKTVKEERKGGDKVLHDKIDTLIEKINGAVIKALIGAFLIFGGAVISLMLFIYFSELGKTP